MTLAAPAGWQLWYDARVGHERYYLVNPTTRRIFDVGAIHAGNHSQLKLYATGNIPATPNAFPLAEQYGEILQYCARVGGDAVP